MILCCFSKDKNFLEDEWEEFSISDVLKKMLCQKNIYSLIDLNEIFTNKYKKISLIRHFAEETIEEDIRDIAKIILKMIKNSHNYVMFLNDQ